MADAAGRSPDSRLEELRRELARPVAHPTPDELRAHAGQVLDWVLKHFATLPDQGIGWMASRQQMEGLLREPVPEAATPFGQVLQEFAAHVAPYSFRVNHPRFFAFIPSAPNYVSVLGDWLCAATNFFAGVWLEAAGPAEVELLVLDWFADLLGFPPSASGILTGGGSEANLTALVVARERLKEAERSRAVLYVSQQRHWSVDRAARIIGLRADQVRPVPADARFRLQPEALQEAVATDRAAGRIPWLVTANAGATNTGVVDPLAALAETCAREKLWFHVDAAYGWPAILDEEEQSTLAGIDRADSLVLDPHKWFAQPFEAGCLLVREGRLLSRAFTLRPEYMQDVEPGGDEVNFSDCGIALTRRFRALKIWLSVKVLGLQWFRAMIRHTRRLAELAQRLLEQEGSFEVLCPRQLSIVCFRYAPRGRSEEQLNELNLALIERLRQSGRVFLSSTRLGDRVALRFCFVNWRTTASDVEEAVDLLAEWGRVLATKR